MPDPTQHQPEPVTPPEPADPHPSDENRENVHTPAPGGDTHSEQKDHSQERIRKVMRVYSLPDQFGLVRTEAAAEGFGNMEELFSQWQDGSNRFNRPGELLAAAWIDDVLAGVGGVTEDIIDPAALRVRRFYVRPVFRHSGVGRSIANFVLETIRPLNRQTVLNTDTKGGAAFWEAMGFRRIDREKTTHVLRSAPPDKR